MNNKNRSLTCPKCGTTIMVDEEQYNSIAEQVRDQEYKDAIEKYKEEYEEKVSLRIREAEAKKEASIKDILHKKDIEIGDLKIEIQQLNNDGRKVQNMYLEEKKNRQYDIAAWEKEKENQNILFQSKLADAIRNEKEVSTIELAKKSNIINELEKKLELANSMKDKAVAEAVTEVQKATNEQIIREKELCHKREEEILVLQSKIKDIENKHVIEMQDILRNHEKELAKANEEIAYHKEYKLKQSVKILGESLEKYCSTEIEKLLPFMPNAHFEKDNTVAEGTKGDFIFREYDDGGLEIVSIMMDMKTESDISVNKHKNESFFKKLDADRTKKQCEFAVLVSTLEPDNELYNQGITMVTGYDKMIVVRPQFLIPLISILRKAAMSAAEYKKEIRDIKNQMIDISNFEENLENCKHGILNAFNFASKNRESSVEIIDNIIKKLNEVKEKLRIMEGHMRNAVNCADGLTIKKLVNNAPAIEELFNNINVDDTNVDDTHIDDINIEGISMLNALVF